MKNFEFYNPAKIIFGKGTEKTVGEHVKKFGTKVLLHYGGGSIKKSGLYDKIIASLEAENIQYVELGGVQPNPRLSLVRKGIDLCKAEGVDFILAVGGGSTIDSAKGIAAGVLSKEDIWYYLENPQVEIDDALPIGVVLTIPAAGSESSNGSVITNDETDMKRDFGSSKVIPKFAIMNPEITYTMPPYQIACGCSDILAHMMERYFTNVKHVDLTDRLIEGAMRSIINYGPKALAYPDNYDIRAEVMLTGTVAHNGSLDLGRIGDWASHNIEHELSGEYDIAHGAGLAIVFPAWMKYVYKENIDKFVQFAIRVFDVDLGYHNKEHIVEEMILRLENWYKSLGLPIRLNEANIGDDKLQYMAEKCMIGRESVGNLKPLYADDIYEIYKLAR